MTLDELQTRKSAYLAAELRILQSQEYSISSGDSSRRARRAELEQVRAEDMPYPWMILPVVRTMPVDVVPAIWIGNRHDSFGISGSPRSAQFCVNRAFAIGLYIAAR